MKRRNLTTVARDLRRDQVVTLQNLRATGRQLIDMSGKLTKLGLVDERGTLTSAGRGIAVFTLADCAWCGGECRRPWINRRGELFCSRSHREESNAALKRFLDREGDGS